MPERMIIQPDRLFLSQFRRRYSAAGLVILLLSCLLLGACSEQGASPYQNMQKHKILHVITRNAPSIYYEGRDGPAGFEYELAKLFADELGVELELRIAPTRSQILSALDNGYTHLAAAGMVAGEIRADRYQFSTSYLETSSVVIYRDGQKKPESIGDLIGKKIAVVSDSYLNEKLQLLKQQHPQLDWQALDVESVELMRMVQDKELDFAVITSHELEIHQAFHPSVKSAFTVGDKQQISWYFPKSDDQTLINLANRFFQRIEADGTLAHLKERYFGHLGQLNYVGARTFIQHINTRLPKYDDAFKAAGQKQDMDWRLLAAVGYQESNWQAEATSPTGVRGLMMLTNAAAKEVGVEDRLNPVSSIHGGARYLAQMRKRLSEDIPEPDRTWLALAAYNIGYAHLEDALMLTRKGGKDPNKWVDVKEFLPLLQKKKYYSQTRYGYARGNEPVIYVQNIRRYYDVLSWMTTNKNASQSIAQVSSSQSRLAGVGE